eukprot:GILI01031706.1.p1 GENE.GILI01031706.1~~GILI01031706.1.p1  ORF type:complete len:124 (-),score=4.11 GILI01031706.1:66-437(-)
MGHGDLLALEPVLPIMAWAALANFLTTGEGGRFRWGNLYGNTAIILAGTVSNSIGYTCKAKKEQAIMGMVVGAMTVVFPLINLVRWKRIIPKPVSTAIGMGYIAWYGHMYYEEVYAIEDAHED